MRVINGKNAMCAHMGSLQLRLARPGCRPGLSPLVGSVGDALDKGLMSMCPSLRRANLVMILLGALRLLQQMHLGSTPRYAAAGIVPCSPDAS